MFAQDSGNVIAAEAIHGCGRDDFGRIFLACGCFLGNRNRRKRN